MRLNLFTNPSVENGAGLWQAVGGSLSVTTARAYSGTHSLTFTGSGTRGRVTPGERFPVIAGKTYTVSGYFQVPTALSTPHFFSVEFYSGATLKGATGLGVYALQTVTAGWSRRTLSFTVPAGATEVLVYAPQAGVGAVSAPTDVIHMDAFLLEEGGTAGTYFDGDTEGYQWDGAPHASRSLTLVPVLPIDHSRIEIETAPGEWTDVTGPTKNISVTRHDSDPGTLSAEVLDANLDPTTEDGLRPGHAVRVRVIDGEGWQDFYVGTLDNIEVEYNPLAKAGRTANVKLSATDAVSFLANQPEARGVGTINDLRWLITGVPFVINGYTTGLGSGTIVARNDNASLWDQVLIVRDSNLGYSWVDKSNRLNVFDHTAMDATSKATIGPDVFSSLDTNFDASQIINAVTVQWLRYDIGTEQANAVPYGPYLDAASVDEWGTRSATFTVQGATEVEADIAAFAQDVLDRNATAEVRPKAAVVPMRFMPDLRYVRDIDLNSRVTVGYHDGVTTKDMRVTGITHTIDASRWIVTFEFALPLGLTAPSQAPSTPTSYIPPGSIGEDELDDDVLDSIADAMTQATAALAAADDAADFAETKNNVYRQTTAPSGGVYVVNDLWFDTDDGNRLYLWTGSAWTVATASYLQTPNGRLTIAPTGLTGYNSVGTLMTSLDAGTGAFYTQGPVVSGGAIDGATVTGGTVQTTGTFARGIKMNSSYLIAYDSVGTPTFSIDAATGAVAMKGSLTSGSSITGASITGGSFVTSTLANRGIKLDSNGMEVYDTFGNKKLWIYNSSGAQTIAVPAGNFLYIDGHLNVSGVIETTSNIQTTGNVSGNQFVGNEIWLQYGTFMKGFDCGNTTANTNASGDITVSHGMGTTPTSTLVTAGNGYTLVVTGQTSSDFTVRCRNASTGAVVGSGTSVQIIWFTVRK